MRKGAGVKLLLGALGIVACALVGVYLAEGAPHVRPSTRRWWRTAREAGISVWGFVHGYAYARWPYDYIGSALGERRELLWKRILFAPFLVKAFSPRRWADGYHGKVMPPTLAKRLVQVREDISVIVPEQVIPFQSARDLVLSHPDHIAALDCPCRLARKNPCLPLDVCLIVGEPFASFILEHHPKRARAITSDEAIAILDAEAVRGHVSHAFFKEAMLERFYAICNCCTCCCGAISAQRGGTPMLISSGYAAQVDPNRCQACGTCTKACPFHVIALGRYAAVDRNACMGCGVCATACPNKALTLVRDATKPAPLDVPMMA